MKSSYKRSERLPIQARIWALALIGLSLSGCDSRSQTEANDPPPPSKTQSSAETETSGLSDLQKQVFDLRVMNRRLANEIKDLKRKKASEEKESPSGDATDSTKEAIATKEVLSEDALSELVERLSALIAALEVKNGEPPNIGIPPADIGQLVAEAEDKPEDKPTEVEGKPENLEPQDSPEDEAGEAFKEFAKMVGVALCAMQPQLCPLLPQLFTGLELFSSTEERQVFLEGIHSKVKGEKLTDEQDRLLRDVFGKHYQELPSGTVHLIEELTKDEPRVQEAIKDAQRGLGRAVGLDDQTLAELETILRSDGTARAKALEVAKLFPVFANPKVKKAVQKLAAELGDKELAEEIGKIGTQG